MRKEKKIFNSLYWQQPIATTKPKPLRTHQNEEPRKMISTWHHSPSEQRNLTPNWDDDNQ